MPDPPAGHIPKPLWWHIRDEFLDLIAPPRCAGCEEFCKEPLCPSCVAKIEYVDGPYCRRCGAPYPKSAHGWPLCVECSERKRPALDGARSVGFHVGPLREMVLAFKFNNRRALAEPMGEMLARRFANEYARPHKLPFDDIDAIVPVVLHPARRSWRGFDQARLLCRELGRRSGKPVWEDVLVRVKNTAPQVELTGPQRAENMRGAFEARKPWRIKGMSLLIVDDVYTTGSTLYEAAKVLKRAGAASVYGLTVTRAAPEWHPGSFAGHA